MTDWSEPATHKGRELAFDRAETAAAVVYAAVVTFLLKET